MKAYSIDLHQKIIDVYENENISQYQLAKPALLLSYWAILGDRRNRAETFNWEAKLKLPPQQLRILGEKNFHSNSIT